jgi:peptidyl-prolyl cis-trans isomerase B (cyclophilin B)
MRTCRLLFVITLVTTPALAQPAARQAVLDTSAGTIVLDLLEQRAPSHVALFVATAQKGEYDGTTFFRMVRLGLIQGGDPVTKDPNARAKYGTGGLNKLKPEITDEKMTRGAVAAVQIPGKPDSAGTQFFICVSDQPGLDGRYTVFARVAEGILVAQKISESAVDDKGLAVDRITVNKVTIRDRPAEVPDPFSTETADDLARYRAVVETSMGTLTIGFNAEKAPGHVRNFLRLAQAGVYDGMSFHRVVKGFVIQTGHVPTRKAPLGETQQRYVRPLKAEFSDLPHDAGTLSMARGEDPDSATSSFFIVTAPAPALDGKYTAFGRVESGMDVVQKIESVAVNGEAPVARVELLRVRVEKR